ncbi:hypothetical protein DVR12_05375 [Chitinophaga silvatica]|uniref:SnoaL-like polyketide cyclase n=1 Tax=Chitinophaga silvatica TaxID=2282649 RepID=A0A3E1YDK2_9BACT|nr:ester cyclase [Chitinophaga silvatica]RFS24635.1 hypothetical protein DVR12_05375 [Chitinophaga silvatica]
MTTQEKNKIIVRKFNEEFLMNGDLEVFETVVDKDFINYNFPASEDTRTITRDFIYTLHKAITNRKLTIIDMLTEGDKVVTFKTIEGTLSAPFMNATVIGSKITLKIIDIVQLRDEKYIGHWSVREVII